MVPLRGFLLALQPVRCNCPHSCYCTEHEFAGEVGTAALKRTYQGETHSLKEGFVMKRGVGGNVYKGEGCVCEMNCMQSRILVVAAQAQVAAWGAPFVCNLLSVFSPFLL